MSTQTTTKTKKKPRIAVVTWYNCLRNIKLAIGAWLNGYELELITKRQGFDLVHDLDFDHMYDHIRIFESNSQLASQLIKSKADIFWCHNEPDMMAVLSNLPHIKRNRMVIHDCHDLPTWHTGHDNDIQMLYQEKDACTKSDYLFVPTPDYIDLIHNKHGVSKDKIIQVNSCSPSIFFPDNDLPYEHGLLYCGQVNVPEMKSQLKFRDCMPLFNYLTSLGITSHIYNTAPMADLTPYLRAGAVIHNTLRMFAANQQYTRYDYGFVGSNVDCREIQVCLPNKLWDCLAAGLPLISVNAKTSGEFIIENNLGAAVQGLENLNQIPWIVNRNGKLINWDYWKPLRDNARKLRHEFTAEKEIRRAFDKIGI